MNNAMSTIITLTNFSYFIAGPVITPSIYQGKSFFLFFFFLGREVANLCDLGHSPVGYALTTGNILSRDKECMSLLCEREGRGWEEESVRDGVMAACVREGVMACERDGVMACEREGVMACERANA